MSLLFPLEPISLDGFSYFPEFLSEKEEMKLLEAVLSINLHPLIFQGFEAKRKVESFGYDYNFDNRLISKGKEIPKQFNFLLDKVAEFLSMSPSDFSEMLVTEYPVGSVINWHRDAPPFDIIIGLSIMSECKFRMRPYDKSKQGRNAIISMPVKSRSLYIIKGEARSNWEHSIAPVKEKRFSITLRTLRKNTS